MIWIWTNFDKLRTIYKNIAFLELFAIYSAIPYMKLRNPDGVK